MLHHSAIASTQARFVFPNGRVCIVTVEIGAPFFSEEKKNWRCELDLRGLENEVTAMIGEDSLSALAAALYFLRIRIEQSRSAGIKVLHPEVGEDFLLDCYFPPGLAKVEEPEPIEAVDPTPGTAPRDSGESSEG